MVYFEFWVELVFGLEVNFGENGSKLAIFVLPDTPTPRRTSPPMRSEASPKRTYKICFCSSFPISLTILHWINENPNK